MQMLKTKLAFFLALYIFTVQVALAGFLWSDSRFYLLAGINLFVLLVIVVLSSSKASSSKFVESSFVREKSRHSDHPLSSEKNQEVDSTPLSESNIEQIKIKINKAKVKEIQGGGLYRFLVFVISLLGFGGLLMMAWDLFDYWAFFMASLAMMLFVVVVMKLANLWQKSVFLSIYVLFYCASAIFGLLGMFASDGFGASLKAPISTFIAGLKGELVQSQTLQQEIDDFGYEITGQVLDTQFSEDAELTGLNEALVVINDDQFSTGTVQTGGQSVVALKPETQAGTTQTTPISLSGTSDVTSLVKEVKKSDTAQVSFIEAIKYLIKTYNIPLSTSRSVTFTYVSKSSADYPYMKTALEKKMIGSTINPNTMVSCDVYVVMKGLAMGRAIPKTADVKLDYWNYAEANWHLNACKKGTKLTFANL